MVTNSKFGEGAILRNKPSKRNGFTLIELLAVIVILAIIALIVVPQVIKILNKARLSSAEDSTYGIVKSAENYITEFMLKNNGELPNQDLTFSCGNDGCSLNEIDKLSSYNLTDLDKLNYKGTKATSGLVKVNENGNIEVNNVTINGFKCNYPVDEKAKCENNNGNNTDDDRNKDTLENKTYRSGEAITNFAGYNWHVIGNDRENVTLLMDAGQIADMAHCGSNNDSSNNCTYNGKYYVYSWDKSSINGYLKNTLYSELKNKITNEIVPVSVCTNPSFGNGVATYGGYLKTEIEKISGASCNSYETDYVRLITNSEYWNLSPRYDGTDTNYPNVSGITRLSTGSDYKNWLSCNTNKCGSSSIYKGLWWTMTSYTSSRAYYVWYTYYADYDGSLNVYPGEYLFGVRPVITIKKY